MSVQDEVAESWIKAWPVEYQHEGHSLHWICAYSIRIH